MSDRRMTVLVVGSTGSIGRFVVKEAVRKGHAVRALAREPGKARKLLPDAEVVVGDLTRPDTLTAAIESVDAIVFTHGPAGPAWSSRCSLVIACPRSSSSRTRRWPTTPTEELLKLHLLQLDQVKDSLQPYQLSKRGNSLRVMAEAVRWGKRGARINTISPGIVMIPLAKDELAGPRGAGYRRMIEDRLPSDPERRTKSVPSVRCSSGRTEASSQAVTS